MIVWQGQPTPSTCGPAVCAMITAVPVADVIPHFPTDKPTRYPQLAEYLRGRGFTCAERPLRLSEERWPGVAICRLKWNQRDGHWLLWAAGRFWDPLNSRHTTRADVERAGGHLASWAAISR